MLRPPHITRLLVLRLTDFESEIKECMYCVPAVFISDHQSVSHTTESHISAVVLTRCLWKLGVQCIKRMVFTESLWQQVNKKQMLNTKPLSELMWTL